MKEILINDGFLHRTGLILEGGEPVDYFTQHGEGPGSVGNVYKGVVDNVVAGMQSAFVDIGLEKNAFLFLDDIAQRGDKTDIRKVLKKGDTLLVQITKEASGVKGARVTTALTLSGRLLVLMPGLDYVGISKRITQEEERDRLRTMVGALRPEGCGFIVRTEAAGADEETLRTERDFLAEQWQALQAAGKGRNAPALLYREDDLLFTVLRDYLDETVSRVVLNSEESFRRAKKIVSVMAPALSGKLEQAEGDLYAARGLESKLRKLLQKRVWLDNGAYLVIDYTEALTVIDVNTGKFTGDYDLKKTILKTNLLAAKEIARQLRLRAIGGIVVVDFIDMDTDEERERVLDALREAAAADRVKTNVVGFAPLGLVELTRKKSRLSLSSVMQCECPYCEGDGRILNAETVLNTMLTELTRTLARTGAEKAVLRVNPRTAEALETITDQLSARLPGISLYLRRDPGMHMEDYNITVFSRQEEMTHTEGLKHIL